MLAWQPIQFDNDPAIYRRDPAEVIDAWAELVQLARSRPAWHQHAACRGDGPDRWWPGRGQPVDDLRATCAACPVADQCAASNDWEHSGIDGGGIWAGLSTRQRAAAGKPAA